MDGTAKTGMRPLHHGGDGRFHNPPDSPASSASTGDMMRFLLGRMRDREAPPLPPGHLLDEAAVRQGMAAAGNPAVTWLGHAAFLLRLAGRTVLTDPYLGEVAGPFGFGPKRFVAPALPVAALPPIDVLVVSHNHYDHLDAATIAALPGKRRIRVMVPLGLGDFFRRRGYDDVTELDWYRSDERDGLAVTALPAVHFSRRGLFDRNRTLWASFSIASTEARVWFGGDTAYGKVFGEIGQRAGPFDLALVGIGAYEPRPIMVGAHATPEEGISIARDIRARRALGMHWGTVKLTPEDPFEAPGRFVAAAEAQGYGRDNALLLKIGESLSLQAVETALPRRRIIG